MAGGGEAAKPSLGVIFLGHVDAGKSTVIGRLMVALGAVDQKTIDKFEKEATLLGKTSFKYAWVTDRLREEREVGLSIDCTLGRVETPKHSCKVIDAPGHRDYVKNAVTCMGQADGAVLVVSVAEGELEAGLSPGGQTREHAILAHTLGVKQMVVAVNKMDATEPSFSQERFNAACKEVSATLKACGINPKGVAFVPVSGWRGDNLDKPASERMDWFSGWSAERKTGPVSGTTLLDAIDAMVPPERPQGKPLRLSVQKVFDVKGVGAVPTGAVDSGTLKVGATVCVAPGGLTSTVRSIQRDGKSVDEAKAGDAVGFALDLPPGALARGCVVGDEKEDPPRETESFVAQIIILNHPGEIRAGYSPTLDCGTAHVPVQFATIDSKLDRKGKVVESRPGALRCGESGLVMLVPLSPVCVESYGDHASLGRFALRDQGVVVAVGVVKSVKKFDKSPKPPKPSAALAELAVTFPGCCL